MAADKNDEIESKHTKKPFLQLQKWRGQNIKKKTIDLLAEKANIMEICMF